MFNKGLELIAISLQICQRSCGNAGRHSRLRDCGSNCRDKAWIKGGWNEVVWPEADIPSSISCSHYIRHIFLGQSRNGSRGGKLHLLIDGGCAHIERPAEDEGET